MSNHLILSFVSWTMEKVLLLRLALTKPVGINRAEAR